MYTAGEIAPSFILAAGCRGGRTDTTRLELMTKLYDVIREVTSVPEDRIVVIVSDTPAAWACPSSGSRRSCFGRNRSGRVGRSRWRVSHSKIR